MVSIVLLLGLFSHQANAQVITRVAGNGTRGFSDDNGPALNAQLDSPRAVGLDAAGNLVIVDHGNDRVRRVSGGVITTIAGTGNIFQTVPDGGAATATFLWRPSSVVVHPSGAIYVADTLNDVVRRIETNGTITIVAGTTNALSTNNGDGGPAKQAKLSWPRGLALDGAGNLFIADSLNNVVRKVTPEGLIFNVAGVYKQSGYNGDNQPATSATLNGPMDVAVDAAGNLYIAEGSANRVRKVGTDGMIRAFAGNGEFGSTGDGGLATAAKLSWVDYIAADRGGNVYISDLTNNRIRKVTPDGKINTIAGTGALGNSGDGGNPLTATFGGLGDIFPLPNGDLYVVDNGNHTIRKIEYNCNFSFTPEITYFDGAAGAGSGTVTASPGCIWGPLSTVPWLTITNTALGTGLVEFSVQGNFTGADRTGFIYAGPSQMQVVQRSTPRIFTDVSPAAYYFDFVNLMQNQGIATGTASNPARFFPEDLMPRSQMAVFMVRALLGGDNFSHTGTPYFQDVPASHPQFKWIQKLRDLNLTSGTSVNPPLYSPDGPVTRGQMAKFLIALRYGANYEFSPPPAPYFQDVPGSHLFYRWIQELRQIGITLGTQTTPPLYSPDQNVTRGQMSAFLARNLYPQFLPAGTPYLTEIFATGSPEAMTLAISAQNTHFDATSVVNAGTGITVTSIQIVDGTHLLANVVVDPSAPKGPRTVIVRTGTEDAVKINGFDLR